MSPVFDRRVLPAAVLLLLGIALFPSPVSASPQEKKQEKKKKDKAESQDEKEDSSKGFRFVFKNHPSFRFGNVLRVDVKSKFQGDFRSFSPELKEDVFDLRRVRVGVEGKFLKHFEYEVEYEIRDLFESREEGQSEVTLSDRLRDAYVNFTYFGDFQIKVGKFKIPLGMDQLTGPARLDFVYRSRIGDTLAPARDVGFVVHGRVFKRGLSYEAGLFERDGENARFGENPGGERTFAGRLTGTPLRLVTLPKLFKSAELGIAFTSTTVPEGAKGIRGRTVAGRTFFPLVGDHMVVQGQRLRVGTDLNWTPGPLSLKGEFIHMRDERLGQSLRQTDLPDLISRGWYLSGTWAVTGEKKRSVIEPRREFLRRGVGAVELAIRYEQIRFGSSEHPGIPLRHQRAGNILSTSDRVWTFGLNWYLNRWIKVQFNGVRERIEDIVRMPVPGEALLWTRVLRLQVVM